MDEQKIVQEASAALSRYIQFDTTNPPGNEMAAALWLEDQLTSRGVSSQADVHEPAPGRGLVVARIPGQEQLKPLMINHHIDVVAADPSQWTHPPFSGKIADGFVWGRGTLDTKGLGILFMIALESLLYEGVRFRRPIVYTAVPDEELGGVHGMRWLVENLGADIDPEWVWDEGSGGLKDIMSSGIMFAVAVAEKYICHVKLTAQGEPGHGSMPHPNNANLILLSALQRIDKSPRPLKTCTAAAQMFGALSKTQKFPNSFLLQRLTNSLCLKVAGKALAADKLTNALFRDTTSINMISGGYQINVIPEKAEAYIDCRLLPDTDADEFRRWLKETIADDRIKIEMVSESRPSGIAPIDNPFFKVIESTVNKYVPGAGLFPLLMAGATDGRYWRERGYPAYGFAPAVLERADVARVHGIDERISLENLRLGVLMTMEIIKRLCA